MASTRTPKKRANPRYPSRCPAHSQDVAISIALLEKNAEETIDRFETIGKKMDKFIGHVEELAMNTTTLTARHDEQIGDLQKQTGELATSYRDVAHSIPQLAQQISEVAGAIKTQTAQLDAIKNQLADVDTRLKSLEHWRVGIMAGAVVLGAVLAKLWDLSLSYLGRIPVAK